jgi:hypothetical protein
MALSLMPQCVPQLRHADSHTHNIAGQISIDLPAGKPLSMLQFMDFINYFTCSFNASSDFHTFQWYGIDR